MGVCKDCGMKSRCSFSYNVNLVEGFYNKKGVTLTCSLNPERNDNLLVEIINKPKNSKSQKEYRGIWNDGYVTSWFKDVNKVKDVIKRNTRLLKDVVKIQVKHT